MSYEERLSGEIMQKQESGKNNSEFPASRLDAGLSVSRKHRKSLILLSLTAVFLLAAASAQQTNNSKPEKAAASAVAVAPKAIKIWPGVAPGSEQWKQQEAMLGSDRKSVV
jgi:hypothetical protein